MTEVSLDEFALAHPVGEPREFQRRSNQWLRTLMGSPLAPRLSVGRASIDIFDALRSEILIRTGNVLRDVALLAAVREVHPRGKVKVTGRMATPALRRLSRAVGANWLELTTSWGLGRVREIAWMVRDSARRATRRSKIPRTKLSILAVPRLPAHLTDVRPVAEELRSRGISTGFVAPALEEQLRSEGLTVVRLGGKAMRRAMLEAPGLGLECMRAAGGVSTEDVTSPVAAHWALRQVLIANLLEVIWFSVSLDELIRTAAPHLVLVGNPYTMEGRVSARLASANRIPSACIEHGSIFAADPIWDDCPVDRVLVWGEPSRRALMSCGVAPEAVEIVGAPRLDPFAPGVQGNKPRRVLVATSGPGDQISLDTHLRFVELLFRAVTELRDVEVVVKLHPKDSPSHYETAQAKHPGAKVQLVRGARDKDGLDIFEFLARSRALVTITSSTALDAMAVGVPVVTVLDGPPDQYRHIEFLVRGCTTRVSTARELVGALEAVLDGQTASAVVEAARTYADEHYANRGHATANAADALMKLAGLGRADG